MTQEALKLALDALENHTAIKHPQQIHYRDKAITAIKEALAQPELCKYGQELKSCTSNPMDCQCAIDAALAQTQEPDDIASILACRDMLDAQPVPQRTWVGSGDLEDSNAYLTPPQRTWVGLTDKEITALFGPFPKYPSEWDDPDFYRLTQAIEARLKELNT